MQISDTPPYAFRAHKMAVTHLVLSPDGQTLYTGSDDGTIKKWDLLKETPSSQMLLFGEVLKITFTLSCDGRMLLVAARNWIYIYRTDPLPEERVSAFINDFVRVGRMSALDRPLYRAVIGQLRGVSFLATQEKVIQIFNRYLANLSFPDIIECFENSRGDSELSLAAIRRVCHLPTFLSDRINAELLELPQAVSLPAETSPFLNRATDRERAQAMRRAQAKFNP
jgi:hypothetical protein